MKLTEQHEQIRRTNIITKSLSIIWGESWQNLFMPYSNNWDVYQPAHVRTLINAFVVHHQYSIIPVFAKGICLILT